MLSLGICIFAAVTGFPASPDSKFCSFISLAVTGCVAELRNVGFESCAMLQKAWDFPIRC